MYRHIHLLYDFYELLIQEQSLTRNNSMENIHIRIFIQLHLDSYIKLMGQQLFIQC